MALPRPESFIARLEQQFTTATELPALLTLINTYWYVPAGLLFLAFLLLLTRRSARRDAARNTSPPTRTQTNTPDPARDINPTKQTPSKPLTTSSTPPEPRSDRQKLAEIAATPYTSKILLNKPELSLFRLLQSTAYEFEPRFEVMAQVHLEEIVEAPDRNKQAARNHIKASRLDFLIVDHNANPVLAIEYHGTGHYRRQSDYRDAAKAAVLRRAGIDLMIVTAGRDPDVVGHDLLKRLLAHHATINSSH